jgi:pyruvate dehydrogenase E1 component
VATLKTLVDEGKAKPEDVVKAMKKYGIDPEKADPMYC